MDVVAEKKKIELVALSDSLIAAERERKTILVETASVRREITEMQQNSVIDPLVRKEAEKLEKDIRNAMWTLKEAGEFLTERTSDYEKLRRETLEILNAARNQRLAKEVCGFGDDSDETAQAISALKRKMELFKLSLHERGSTQLSQRSQRRDGGKKLEDIEHELEAIGLESRAKNLEEQIRQRQGERKQLENEILKVEQSIHVTQKRNNALLLRLDVQIVETEERNRSSREKVALLTHEIENLKRELRRFGDSTVSSALF